MSALSKKSKIGIGTFVIGLTIGAGFLIRETAQGFFPPQAALLEGREEGVETLNRLLALRYRIEAHSRGFDQHLDELLAKRGQEDQSPLDSDDYRQLTVLHYLLDKYVDGAVEQLRELNRNATNPDTRRSGERALSQRRLNQVRSWFDGRDEADQLQLRELYEALAEKAPGIGIKTPAWAQESDLEPRFQALDGEIGARAEKASRDRSLDVYLLKAIKEFQDQTGETEPAKDESSESLPATLPDSALKGGAVFPSTGAAGNFDGLKLDSNLFVFTFDDGPGTKSTLRLHHVLGSHSDSVNKRGAPATFFVLVEKALENPSIIQEHKRLGYRMNNHSWTHPNFAKLSSQDLRHQIVDSTKELNRIFGYSFRFFRCPYGACIAPKVPEARKLMADLGLIHVYWAIDSLDWKNIGRPQKTADEVIKQMRLNRKGVILMHDIHESTIDAAQLVLNWIKSENSRGGGIKLIDLEEAVDRVNGIHH